MKIEEALFDILDNPSTKKIDDEIEKAQKSGVNLVPYGDEMYPKALMEIHDPPKILYITGKYTDMLNNFCIAIVGSRKATPYGKMAASRISTDLSRRGIVVVSGLAYGIDSAAHAAAAKEGETIAVLGSGIDVVYPRANARLFEEVKENGCLVSELPFGAQPQKWTFPKRNRIIAGLSMGVVVVEAAHRSGSLITARLALEEGREVFAVPGGIFSKTSEGTNYLIKQGAKCVTSVDDVLDEFGYLKIEDNSEKSKDPVVNCLKNGPKSVEEIHQITGIAAKDLNAKLTMLEINGSVRYDQSGKFTLS